MRIGVFDSGIGGLTVLRELRRRIGAADYIYLGDTAHLPYGTKSPAHARSLSIMCAQIRKSKRVDALVVACNTASSLALDVVRAEMHPIPVLGVVEPGAHSALAAWNVFESEEVPILVLATNATVKSQAYGNLLRG